MGGMVLSINFIIQFLLISFPTQKKEFSKNQKNDFARQQGPGFFCSLPKTIISRNAGHVTGNRAAPAENPLS